MEKPVANYHWYRSDILTFWSIAGLLVLLMLCDAGFFKSAGWPQSGLIIAGYGGLLAVIAIANISRRELGLLRRHARKGIVWGAGAMLLIAVIMNVIFLFEPTVFKDSRYNLELPAVILTALVLLPLKTVLFEELAFRGILPALLGRYSRPMMAGVLSSVAFGLWHLTSAQAIGSFHLGSLSVPSNIVVGGVVIATATFGGFLYLLRLKSQSLIAPIAVHWFINASAILYAYGAWHI